MTETAIAPELSQMLNTLKALTLIHNLLGVGGFQRSHFEAVERGQSFLKSWHEKVSTEALAHPDAGLVPELQTFKEEQMEESRVEAQG